jgi:hypothetical protein
MKNASYLVPHAAGKSIYKVHYKISNHIIYLVGVEQVEGNVFSLEMFRATLRHAEKKYLKPLRTK